MLHKIFPLNNGHKRAHFHHIYLFNLHNGIFPGPETHPGVPKVFFLWKSSEPQRFIPHFYIRLVITSSRKGPCGIHPLGCFSFTLIYTLSPTFHWEKPECVYTLYCLSLQFILQKGLLLISFKVGWGISLRLRLVLACGCTLGLGDILGLAKGLYFNETDSTTLGHWTLY